VSPRKSSTSSAKPLSPRPRYLGIEVAGELSLPRRWIEQELGRLLGDVLAPEAPPRVRLIRWEGHRGIAEVDHLAVEAARRAWNREGPGPARDTVRWRTLRVWGTLRGAKRWLGVRDDRPPR
jgi:RNase P/RNase MRP subunit POP5